MQRLPKMTDKGITKRQLAILNLTAYGMTDGAIANRIGVSRRLVQLELATARTALGANSRTHLVAVAIQLKLIQVRLGSL